MPQLLRWVTMTGQPERSSSGMRVETFEDLSKTSASAGESLSDCLLWYYGQRKAA